MRRLCIDSKPSTFMLGNSTSLILANPDFVALNSRLRGTNLGALTTTGSTIATMTTIPVLHRDDAVVVTAAAAAAPEADLGAVKTDAAHQS